MLQVGATGIEEEDKSRSRKDYELQTLEILYFYSPVLKIFD
jgi:hypothetical protein